MQKMKPDNFAVRWVLSNKSSEKGMDLLACVCAPPASVQPEKKTSFCRTRNKSPDRGKTTGLVKPNSSNRFSKMDMLTTYIIKFGSLLYACLL